MINFSNISIKASIAHLVGNSSLEEPLRLSEYLLELDETLSSSLKSFLINSIKVDGRFFSFHHETNLNFNEVFTFSNEILDNESSLIENSKSISKHLYSSQINPKIKNGHLLFLLIDGILLDGTKMSGLSILKVEDQSNFFQFNEGNSNWEISVKSGFNISKKVDKGCLIINDRPLEGYSVFLSDLKSDAKFWIDDFLKVINIDNGFSLTDNFLSLTKDYVSTKFTEDFEVGRADQADLLNRSMNFFKENEQFDRSEFENNVFQDPDLIDSFNSFQNIKSEVEDFSIPEQFEISNIAVKKKSRVFKSVLKLDKNFHVYIHGNRELIEKGVDPGTGKKYYKIYYEEET